jgi:membrane protease YdiL (CAAX protease family)
MTAGHGFDRRYFLVLALGWTALASAGAYLATQKSIAPAVAVPVVAAFLLEYAFYLIPGFARVREWLSDRVPVLWLALGIALSAIAPYLTYSIPTGSFHAPAFARLAGLALFLAYWYVFRRPSRAGDLMLLALVSSALVSRFFRQIYLSPIEETPLDILGKLMLFRLVPMVMLMIRELDGTGYGFWPTAREWKIGARYFALFLPLGLALFAAFGMLRFQTSANELLSAPFQFLAFLWVVGLAEEFLARGLLQRWLADWTGRPLVAMATAAIAFGAAHLWFPPGYPNWRFAAVAAAAGFFYGKAYAEAGGVRAAAVTHALVVTVWRTILS